MASYPCWYCQEGHYGSDWPLLVPKTAKPETSRCFASAEIGRGGLEQVYYQEKTSDFLHRSSSDLNSAERHYKLQTAGIASNYLSDATDEQGYSVTSMIFDH